MPVTSELHDYSTLLRVLAQATRAYLDGEEPSETFHSAKSRHAALRRVLLFQINSIIDAHEAMPGGNSADPREAILMDMITSDLKVWDIVLTEDGEAFTFEEGDTVAE